MLVACPISDALITQIPADEEPLCENAAVYAIILLKKYEQTSSGEVLCILVMVARGGWCNWHSSEEIQEY